MKFVIICILKVIILITTKSNCQQTTPSATTYETYPTFYPTFTYPTYPTQPTPPTTTAWSVAYSTESARNSTLGVNSGVAYEATDINGYDLVRRKQCSLNDYLFSFRYLTEPAVCAEWCRRESTCLGFMASVYSGACKAFIKCNEVDDEGWVIFYRRAATSTTRLWAGTTPTSDGSNFVDLTTTSNVLTVQPVIQKHFISYGNALKTVFSSANSSSSTSNNEKYPRTQLTMTQSIVFKQTLQLAWKARLVFGYQQVEGWVTEVPPPIDSEPSAQPLRPPSNRRRYKCNQGTVDAACKLLRLNNEGILFLLPWLWEGLQTKDLPPSPEPDSVAPLFTIVSLCYGDAPPSYTNELVCPDPAMLNAIGALAHSVFNTYSEPLYVASILGSPAFEDEDGLPSVTHFYGSGVDFLCGMAAYGASERGFDESCALLVRLLRKPQYGRATPCDDVFLPSQSQQVGCGQVWWPIPTVHCDKTIIGSKK